MGETQPVGAQAPELTHVATRRSRVASPATALVISVLVLALTIAAVPLASLARQSLNASGGSLPVWITAPFAMVGLVVAWRKPGNPLGWIMLGTAAFAVLSEDASFYTVADYGLRHGDLPLGWVALLAQPGWAPGIVLIGLAVLLFPDGQPPSSRLRWLVLVYAAVAALWIAGAVELTVRAIISHHIQVDSAGNLLLLSSTDRAAGWWNLVQDIFFPLLLVCWVTSLAGQVFSYRRSSGDRREQLKWLAGGVTAVLVGAPLNRTLSGLHGITGIAGGVAGAAGLLAFPVCMGVAIFRYRLYDIDRVISRTLAYAIVTGLLVGVYAGLVLLTTRVFGIHSSVAVAVSTLAAAAFFNPVRRRVQLVVDRRFNRARYDADQIAAAYAARLKDATDLDAVRDDLASVVQHVLEPAHVSLWISQCD
ncbi:MAG: hypothetical protein ABSB76_39555 [Streptosporangiaceae bacterium]|jgi:hypothetical protein